MRRWGGDDGLVRWGCFPCGRKGDVFDFIQEREEIDFHQALQRAREIYAEIPEERRMSAPARAVAATAPAPAADAGEYTVDVLAAEWNIPADWLCERGGAADSSDRRTVKFTARDESGQVIPERYQHRFPRAPAALQERATR